MGEIKHHILVVDDEEDICEILKFNLETEDYIVDTAHSAEEALEMDVQQYNLILLDVMMGEISVCNGKETERKRGDKEHSYHFPDGP